MRRVKRLAGEPGPEDFMPEMPPIVAAGHVVTYLFEVGPAMAGGMGPAPLTHQEIEAWQRNTGVVLTPWEARAIRRLSCEYVGQLAKAKERKCPEPIFEALPDEARAAAAKAAASKSLRDEMRALAR